MENQGPDINAIIVNFRSAQMTIRAIRSILKHEVTTIKKIIVVDNGSNDNSAQSIRSAYPEVVVAESVDNRGFSAGINIALKRADSKYILVLNPDIYFEENSAAQIISYMDSHSDVSIAGFDLIGEDGLRQYSARRFYSALDIVAKRLPLVEWLLPKRVHRHLMKEEWMSGHPFDAEWIMGAAFLIRCDLFKALHGMDEDYFLYMEDVDLCARIWGIGGRVVAFPGAKLVHAHQRSSSKNMFGLAARRHLASCAIFYSKFHIPLVCQPGVERVVHSGRAVRSSARFYKQVRYAAAMLIIRVLS